MDRLLCGDVGVGKTEVALRAAFKCVMGGKQCAILAPTTILAWQHFNTTLTRMESFPIRIGLLSRYRTPKEQKETLRGLKDGTVDIVVGTHPHIVQGIEAYQDSYILYSLGNLVFGGNVDPDDRDAYLARVTFTVYEDHCDAPELTVVPIRLTALDKGTDYRPVVADEADSARIFKRIMKLSSGMGDFVNGELTEGL